MKIIGHRGGTAEKNQQNTLNAVKAAIQNGLEAIEIDVRVSRDNVVLLNHDDHVEHDGQSLLIRTSSFKQLKDLKSDITTLSEVFSIAQSKLKLLIEIKPVEPVGPVISVIRQALNHGWQAKDIQLCSFDLSILKALQQDLPQVQLAVSESWSGVRATHRARSLKTKSLIMNQRWLWIGYVRPLANRGYDIAAYVVNDSKRARKLARMGVGTIISDYPKRLAK